MCLHLNSHHPEFICILLMHLHLFAVWGGKKKIMVIIFQKFVAELHVPSSEQTEGGMLISLAQIVSYFHGVDLLMHPKLHTEEHIKCSTQKKTELSHRFSVLSNDPELCVGRRASFDLREAWRERN